MSTKSLTFKTFLLLIMALFLASCSGQSNSNSAGAVEAYLEALVAKGESQLINSSCAAWEADARQELRTFDAVTVNLQDLKCQETAKDGEISLVACTGKIVANYGNEVLEINLSDRTYQTIQEGGEWRMCGYR